MYNLKSVTLKNFQTHDNLTVNFTDNVNVISGLTGVGKSAIYKAILWVYGYSDISENDFRREGTNETSVIVKLSSGGCGFLRIFFNSKTIFLTNSSLS